MIWRAKLDARCDYFNDTWLAFTGRTLEEETGDGSAADVHPDDLAQVAEQFLDAFHKHQKFEMEYRLRRHDGIYRWIINRGAPVFGNDGTFQGFVGSCTDIDDRRRARIEREAHLQDTLNLYHELAASIAHDIKQPIAAALASAEICLRELDRPVPDVDGLRDAATVMSREVRHATEIIDRLRALYTRGAPRQDPVDMNDLVNEMVALLDNEATVRGIPIRTELDPTLPSISGDRVQLQQVLLNLMLNALEATQTSSGELSIRTQRHADGHVEIAVTDSGIGLPAEHGERVFDAFFTTKPQGIGMGLAISRAIVEAHGGALWATANPTAGTTFRFILPNSPGRGSHS